jgi:signal transduction histidine kinase/HAMP domain-containing protein
MNMRLGLKAKLTGLISLLVLLVVLATSTLYLSSLTQQALTEVESKGQYVASEIYHQARSVLAQAHMPGGADPNDSEALRRFVQATLAADRGFASLIESVVGYSPTIYYVSITDTERRVLVHSDPGEIGRRFEPAPAYRDLVRAGLLRQLRVVYGPPRIYEVALALDLGDKPLGDVRVGVSTLFLRNQITPQLSSALALSALAIVLATASAALLSYRMLRPLQTISHSVDRMARGEYGAPLPVKGADEWGILSSKLNLLGEQIRGEKAAFVALKENLDQLFANLADGLLLFDKQDRLVLATPAVSRFLRRTLDTSGRVSAGDVFSADRPLDGLLREAFEGRRSLPWQVVELTGELEIPRVAVSVQFVQANQERIGSLVTLRDASTRARLEDQLDVTAKLAALGKLTSGVAHEVKNPLNAMVLQLEILKAKLQDQGEHVKPQVDILSAEIHRLNRVVKTFLDFNRPLELHPVETDVESLVHDVFTLAEPHAQQNNVRLLIQINGALPRLLVDRDLMKQALLNLVLNGCQAMPAGGELKVTPRALADRLELEIADQGVGIPAEVRERVFSLYFTTKPGGSGVGLAMAYRIIQLHNGSVDFTSEINRGTTFRITLPR